MMNLQSIRPELSPEDISNKTVIQLYESIGKLFGVDGPEARYDCRCILVSKNIQDAIYRSYEQLYPEEFAENPVEFSTQVTMLLANSGPKVDETLSNNTVEVQEGFFTGMSLGSLMKTGLKKIAVITDGYVRDGQVYLGDAASSDADPDWQFGDDFVDLKYPCQFIGIFEGESDIEIAAAAAVSIGVAPDIISLIEIQ